MTKRESYAQDQRAAKNGQPKDYEYFKKTD